MVNKKVGKKKRIIKTEMKMQLRKKKSAEIEFITGMFLLIMLTALLVTQLQVGLFRTSASFVEDALAASNLASAVIDIQEYGRTHTIIIKSPEQAYELYREAVRQNLKLDDNWENSNKDLIYGQVEILQYEVYNVKGKDVTIYSFGAEGEAVTFRKDGVGEVQTPDGTTVESTSVYSRIGFPVKGVFGVEIAAEKQKTVDIVSNFPPKEE